MLLQVARAIPRYAERDSPTPSPPARHEVTGLEIVLAPATLAARAERLGRLEPEELRKKAIVACRDADATALWDLTEAHLVTRGRKGASVSPRTLETYHDSCLLYTSPSPRD